MAFETSFNQDFAKKLSESENPDTFLEDELYGLKERVLELNKARKIISEGYEIVLKGLKQAFNEIDLSDPNIKNSPDRMARSLIEICSGLGISKEDIFSTSFPAENYNQVIILKDIDFTSICSHHFIPFSGMAHVGYLPDVRPGSTGKVVGLSKLARIVDVYSKRPQLQERLSYNIMNAINQELRPQGVMVVVEGNHGCLNCRGAKKINASMITSALEGKFREDHKLREEFLCLIQKKG
jgi:GTP cyclohydrolase IA